MKNVISQHVAMEADFDSYECPSWDEEPLYRDTALRWHLRGFEAGLAFARNND